jgi:plasmid stabilization system protein ParE
MNVRFTLEALTHIAEVRYYLAARSPRGADRIVERIFAEADRLGDFPQIGHAGIVAGTLEWIVPRLPYIIVHEIAASGDEVVVLGIFHGAQHR